MSPRKFFRNLSILCVFAFILTAVGYGTFVYADKYSWNNLSSPMTNWQAVAMASNSYGYAGMGTDLYRTTNGGSAWNYIGNMGGPQYSIRSIATSEDGLYVIVSYDDTTSDGGFAVSNNYGASFTTSFPYTAEYYGVAMSESGQYMYATDQTNTRLLYSSNYGQSGTWNYVGLSYTPTSVAASNDGMYVYTATTGYILGSSDYGLNNNTIGPAVNFEDVAVSANGQHVYAVPTSGYPLYSPDYGATFYALTNAGSRPWRSVSVSGDGSKVVLVESNGSASQVFSSRDFGVNFTQETFVGNSLWRDVSLSSDGYTALLASSDSYLYRGSWDTTSPSITSVSSNTANGTYKAGQNIQLLINFSEPVYTSTLALDLETGSTDRQCNTGGIAPGATSTTCIYTIQNGDVTSDLSTIAITGTLTDDAGNTSSNHSGALNSLASNRNIVIDAVAPSVSLITPTNGSVASSTVSLSASASDVGTGVVGVQFRVGTTSIGAEDTSSPYAATWNSTAVADGSYTLSAVVRDGAGNFATSSATITVDNTAPVAPGTPDLLATSDTGISNSDNVTASTTPQFTSSCVTGSTVRFFHGGSTLIGAATCSATSSATIISSTLTSGTYSITAQQSDAVGNTSSSSSALSVTIDNSAPIISITSPADGSNASGTISLVASSTDALSSVYGVLFSHGTTTISSEDTSSPYSVSFDTTTLADGTYTLNAVARDVIGNYSTSTISITITNTVATSSTTTTSSGGSTQSSGPTAYSSVPTSAIPGIYNPVVNNGVVNASGDVISPTKVIASTIIQSAGINPNFNFTRNATIRTINSEVINIQRLLNTMGYTVATTGAGSKGNESSFFGPKTRLALIRFQRAFAIPATGFFGPLSRAAMNRILNSVK